MKPGRSAGFASRSEAARLLSLALSVLSLSQFVALAAAPADDLRFLQDGVSAIGSPGIPGPLCLLGGQAFAVVTGKVSGQTAPVVAAGRLGKGRVVAFGHEGYFGDLKQADTGRLLVNCVRWAASKTQGEGKPVVGVHGFGALQAHLKGQGFEVKPLAGRVRPEGLKGIDVVVLNAASSDLPGLEPFVRAGGGVLAGIPGWGWQQLNPGKSLADDLPGNRLFSKAGIVWGDGYQSDTVPNGFAVGGEPPRMAHAGAALDALMAVAEGKGPPLSKEDTGLAVSAISRAVLALPTQEKAFRPRLDKLLAGHAGTIKLPSAKRPLTDADGLAKVILTMQLRRDGRLTVDQIKAHPAAGAFPGAVPADAVCVTRKLVIDTAIPAWHSTGLYAAPGEVVTAKLPSRAARKGLWLRIGAHNDSLWHHSTWRRAPAVCRRFRLDQAETQGANAFGGLVYIEVPGGCKLGELEVEVAGAVQAPLFVRGETDLKAWRESIRQRPAPWAELAGRNVIITVPSANVRDFDDPERLMSFWDKVLDACADLATIPRKRTRPERYVTDVQISAGYMHSGYPIMTHLDAAPRFVNYDLLSTKGDWGMFHEMGHNHQSGHWTFGGAGETTVNLFTVYILDTVVRTTGGHGGIDPARRARKIREHIAGGADFGRWKSDPFLSLAMYLQLKEAFGWDAYKKVFAEYRALPRGEHPKSDDDKRDQWMVRFSRTVGRNLGPFFEAWGVPTSAQARAAIADLPAWLPDGLHLIIHRDSEGLVTIRHPAGRAEIRYTLDRSEPTEASPKYAAPFRMPNAGTVKARAYANGKAATPVVAAEFPFRAGRSKWKILRASSHEPGEGDPRHVLDGRPATIWHTRWRGDVPRHPHELQIDLGSPHAITGFSCLPRQDGVNGRIARYELYVSQDGKAWGKPVKTGTFADSASPQAATLDKPVIGRYIRLVALSEAKGGPWASLAEFDVRTGEPRE